MRRTIPRIGQTYEIILSTYDHAGRPNAAPMGIKFVSRKLIQIYMFKGSDTMINVLTKRCAVANLTSDANLFFKLALEKKKGLSANSFLKARLVDAPHLRSVDGYIELTLIRSIPDNKGVMTEFSIKRFHWNYVAPTFYSRAAHALIESTIHATRVHEFLAQGKKKKASKLIHIINHYKEIVERVSPGSDYEKSIKKLQSRIKRWKRR